MPKRKKYYIDFPKLLLYEAFDHLMFSYILGMQRGMPSATLKKCMELFMEDYNLNEDNYPMEQALQTWYRMFKSYVIFRKLDKYEKL